MSGPIDTDELRRLLAEATAQNSVVCLRRYAEKWSGLHKDIAVDFANGADALDALPALLDRLEAAEKALEPFAAFAEHAIDDEGWDNLSGRERICDWFGPSDFREALFARAALRARAAALPIGGGAG